MFHWSSSVNKKNPNIIIKTKAVLYAIDSVWACLHMLLVYLNLSIMFPSCIWINWLHRSICCAPISLVTMQHQSIVLQQSPYQGHIITVLDTAQPILVSTEQTGIGSAAINLYGVTETCSFVSRCIMHRLWYSQMWPFQFGSQQTATWNKKKKKNPGEQHVRWNMEWACCCCVLPIIKLGWV